MDEKTGKGSFPTTDWGLLANARGDNPAVKLAALDILTRRWMKHVKITATDGPMKGKAFTFEEHDTFLFGRLANAESNGNIGARQRPRSYAKTGAPYRS